MLEIKVKVGSRGQVVIPKPIREMFHINAGEDMFFRVENNEILIRKEQGLRILNRMVNRFGERAPEPKMINWKEMYYSQFDDS